MLEELVYLFEGGRGGKMRGELEMSFFWFVHLQLLGGEEVGREREKERGREV